MADEFLYSLRRYQVYKVDDDGVFAGTLTDPNDVDTSGGSVVTGALVREDPIEVASPDVTRRIYREVSGGDIRQTVDGGVSDFSAFNITLARDSSALNALATNAKTNTTRWQGVTLGGKDSAPETLNTVGFVYFQNSSVKGAGGFTPGKVRAKVYLSGTLAPLEDGGNMEEGDNPTPLNYTYAPSRGLKFFTGETLASLDLGFSDAGAISVPMKGMETFFHIVRIYLDGTTDSVTLPYKPLYSDVTATGRNLIAKNGVASGTAITSINTTTGAVAPAANSDGDWIVLAYPTAFEPTA